MPFIPCAPTVMFDRATNSDYFFYPNIFKETAPWKAVARIKAAENFAL